MDRTCERPRNGNGPPQRTGRNREWWPPPGATTEAPRARGEVVGCCPPIFERAADRPAHHARGPRSTLRPYSVRVRQRPTTSDPTQQPQPANRGREPTWVPCAGPLGGAGGSNDQARTGAGSVPAPLYSAARALRAPNQCPDQCAGPPDSPARARTHAHRRSESVHHLETPGRKGSTPRLRGVGRDRTRAAGGPAPRDPLREVTRPSLHSAEPNADALSRERA